MGSISRRIYIIGIVSFFSVGGVSAAVKPWLQTFKSYFFKSADERRAKDPHELRVKVMRLEGEIRSAAEYVPDLLKLINDDETGAVLLCCNSGGGNVGVSQTIASLIETIKRKKPVVAFVEGNCVSGAYLAASAANRIVAQPMANIGSIGAAPSVAVKSADGRRLKEPHELNVKVFRLEGEIRSTSEHVPALLKLINDDEIDAVLLCCNSGGGSAGVSQTIASLIEILKRKKPVVAFVEGACASGAYLAASAANYIIAQPMASIGSIGVVVAVERPKRITFITAGKFKRPKFLADGTLDPEFESIEKQEVMDVYKTFCNIVARNRSIPIEDVMAQEARTYVGSQACELKLIDQVGTYEDALHKLVKLVEQRNQGSEYRKLRLNYEDQELVYDLNTEQQRYLAPMKQEVTKAYQVLCDIVARNRSISQEEVMAQEARTYIGMQAYEQKLIDVVGSYEDALNILAELAEERKEGSEYRKLRLRCDDEELVYYLDADRRQKS